MSDFEKKACCPECGAQLSLGVKIEYVKLAKTPSETDWKSSLDERQLELIELAKNAGLLGPFTDAVRASKGAEAPRNIEPFFVHFWNTARPKIIPSFALAAIRAELPDGWITYVSAQGVAAVLVDGQIKWFIPSRFSEGTKSPSSGTGATRILIPADTAPLSQWIKTRCGYVAFNGAMYNELQRMARGASSRGAITNHVPVQGGLANPR